MHVILVEFTIKPEFTPAFIERVKQQAQDSLAVETDCHVFDVSVASDNQNRVLLYEVYTDKAAFDAHLQSAHFHEFNQTVAPWISDKKLSSFEKI